MTTRPSTLAAPAAHSATDHARWTAWLRRHQEARRARRAVAHALARVHATDPFLHDSLFDRVLLARPAARAALAERDPEALARAWTEQFAYRDPRRRERDVRSLTPLARTFLGWVDEAPDGRIGG